jgi:hypothetical protein
MQAIFARNEDVKRHSFMAKLNIQSAAHARNLDAGRNMAAKTSSGIPLWL